jgi:hypothetical protein
MHEQQRIVALLAAFHQYVDTLRGSQHATAQSLDALGRSILEKEFQPCADEASDHSSLRQRKKSSEVPGGRPQSPVTSPTGQRAGFGEPRI